MIIRKASVTDAAAICAIHQAAARQLASTSYSPAEIEAWVGALTPASYAAVLDQHEMVVAEQDGRVVAFGELDSVRGEVEAVYVSPQHSRRGIGKAVLDAVEAIAHERRLSSLHLRATLNAVPFYVYAGYFAEGEVVYHTSAGPILRVMSMSKSLAPPD